MSTKGDYLDTRWLKSVARPFVKELEVAMLENRAGGCSAFNERLAGRLSRRVSFVAGEREDPRDALYQIIINLSANCPQGAVVHQVYADSAKLEPSSLDFMDQRFYAVMLATRLAKLD
jgi:hypothetical protein